MMKQKVNFFWFRRDLRLDDNTALFHALQSDLPVIPVFIFDDAILERLPQNDARVSFIYDSLQKINEELAKVQASILIKKGKTAEVWKSLVEEFDIQNVFFNKDYEPYAIKRDVDISALLKENNVGSFAFKDHVIFEEKEISKSDGLPYTIYTPYKNKWLEQYRILGSVAENDTQPFFANFAKNHYLFPQLSDIGFERSSIKVIPHNLSQIANYKETRDFPALDSTSYLSPHLRFGTVSVRKLVNWANRKNQTFLSELIWREFFIQILYSFPHVANRNFKSAYDGIEWQNNEDDFKRWCSGTTGYPMVDAGMRQLNKTGYMHNRVRMVVASFLCKHLLIDWQWGEAYFAEKLLDFELASNVGNWQWAAGTGCDAAPYFRVFNPEIQLKKFDEKGIYIRKWIPEFSLGYNKPMIDHAFARERAIATYKAGILK
ncbi:deoxyribodipyrimidine photo-lyase [Flavobacterium sp. Fl-77]|uniref:Deoxyribodipyrimidine photo-lyase n=1 Tax=Flavobacterium flavipigmentatum TaxID=2893884 RepID=A0AAJ2SD07_9FLAO|nr:MULTISPECIES: deoxyribodipyrimidine photo-lyase [unclassified Flavobacterium]MDX6182515.1 deoxyribodipyrimidine photo-lyase [Flavobacterium sp. Fl-33]MDX6185572.1 deoxyribodipyrimidine photo-lyase [Flavobacterium sp. Fl-77]UFH40513.1 DNA photolyase family protein [Flavobacterium sp. F-70]